MENSSKLNLSQRISEDQDCCYRKTTSKNLRIIWEITRRCNYRCNHCFVDLTNGEGEVSTNKCISFIEELTLLNISKFMFTGGEPTIREDLPLLIEQIRLKHPNAIVDMTSNLSLITKELVLRLKTVGLTEITTSIDGVEDAHDKFRNKRGAFTVLQNKIEDLRAVGLDVDGVCTICKLNYNHVQSVVDKAVELGFSSITFSGLIDRGVGFVGGQDLRLSIEELKETVVLIKKARNSVPEGFSIRTVALLNRNENTICPHSDLVVINAEGYVSRCNLTQDRIGNFVNACDHGIVTAIRQIPNVYCKLGGLIK